LARLSLNQAQTQQRYYDDAASTDDDDDPMLSFRDEYEPEPPSLKLSDAFEGIIAQLEGDLTRISPPDPATVDLENLVYSIRFAAHSRFESEAQAPDGVEMELVQTLNDKLQDMAVLTSSDTAGNAFLPNLSDQENARLQQAREAFRTFFRAIADQWPYFEEAVNLFDDVGVLKALLSPPQPPPPQP
jgi:hypothetical protein